MPVAVLWPAAAAIFVIARSVVKIYNIYSRHAEMQKLYVIVIHKDSFVRKILPVAELSRRAPDNIVHPFDGGVVPLDDKVLITDHIEQDQGLHIAQSAILAQALCHVTGAVCVVCAGPGTGHRFLAVKEA